MKRFLRNAQAILAGCAMMLVVNLVAATQTATAESTKSIAGAGSTHLHRLYERLGDAYAAKTDIGVHYSPLGSGGGMRAVQDGSVDFAITDLPLSLRSLDELGLAQFPVLVSAVVPVVNIPGIGADKLNLSGELLAEIFLGEVKKWNDPRIAELNPELSLPNLPITIVRRSDGSYTTLLLTDYLSKANDAWRRRIGPGTSVNWPPSVSARGNEGIASFASSISGSVSYLESTFARNPKLNAVRLRNRDGNFVKAEIATYQAAAANADWKNIASFQVLLTDARGRESWPITGASFALISRQASDRAAARRVLEFFRWTLDDAGALVAKLGYVPLPADVSTHVSKLWRSDITDRQGQAIWP